MKYSFNIKSAPIHILVLKVMANADLTSVHFLCTDLKEPLHQI